MEDWKRRMIVEYVELKDRHSKLCVMLSKHTAGILEFKLNCPVDLLRRQEQAMRQYLQCLEERAPYEGVELPE